MGERLVRKIGDRIDMSYLPGETRWNYTGRIRELVVEQELEGWCCRGDALVDVFVENTCKWSVGKCIVGIATDFSMRHLCLDDIEHCPRHANGFDGSSPDEKLARAFRVVGQAGYRVRLSDCRWRDGS